MSVLDAQRNKLEAGDERAQAATAVRVSLVSLYRAFGGGWFAEPPLRRADDNIDAGEARGSPSR